MWYFKEENNTETQNVQTHIYTTIIHTNMKHILIKSQTIIATIYLLVQYFIPFNTSLANEEPYTVVYVWNNSILKRDE